MFSVSTSVVLLVFFVSQGQSTTTLAPVTVTATPSATPNQAPNATTSNTMTPPMVQPSKTFSIVPSAQTSTREPPANTTTPIVPPPSSISSLSTSASITPPAKQTCAKLGVVIDKPWNDNYKNHASEHFRNLSDAFSSALKKLYSDSTKYTYVEVTEVNFKEKEGNVFASAKLCLVFKGENKVFIEDVFKDKVATGKLDVCLTVINGSAEFDPLGVSFKDWKAKEGECKRTCEGAAGPFSIVKKCEPDAGFSCDGLKEPTEETEDCAKYCSSVAVSVSSIILVIGIFLSSSFQ